MRDIVATFLGVLLVLVASELYGIIGTLLVWASVFFGVWVGFSIAKSKEINNGRNNSRGQSSRRNKQSKVR